MVSQSDLVKSLVLDDALVLLHGVFADILDVLVSEDFPELVLIQQLGERVMELMLGLSAEEMRLQPWWCHRNVLSNVFLSVGVKGGVLYRHLASAGALPDLSAFDRVLLSAWCLGTGCDAWEFVRAINDFNLTRGEYIFVEGFEGAGFTSGMAFMEVLRCPGGYVFDYEDFLRKKRR